MERCGRVSSTFDSSADDTNVVCDALDRPAALRNGATEVQTGNTTASGTRSYTYDDAGRMSEYLASGVVTRTFAFNGRGERVGKRVPGTPGSDTWYVYDEAGHLIGEYRGNGTRVREYVWLDDVPVAVFVSHAGTTYQYVLTDHLNTPRAVVLPTTNAIVWRWDLTGSAFGEHAVAANPDGDANSYTLPLRYPGQYHDGETALYYNYFRDYDPTTGRYTQSDPIGLGGGLSTFSYVGSRPLTFIDSRGLDFQDYMSCQLRSLMGSDENCALTDEFLDDVAKAGHDFPENTRSLAASAGEEACIFGRCEWRCFITTLVGEDIPEAMGKGFEAVTMSALKHDRQMTGEYFALKFGRRWGHVGRWIGSRGVPYLGTALAAKDTGAIVVCSIECLVK